MKKKGKNTTYETTIQKELFGRPYTFTVSYSSPPPDPKAARLVDEAVAEAMMRDFLLAEMFGYDVHFPPIIHT